MSVKQAAQVNNSRIHTITVAAGSSVNILLLLLFVFRVFLPFLLLAMHILYTGADHLVGLPWKKDTHNTHVDAPLWFSMVQALLCRAYNFSSMHKTTENENPITLSSFYLFCRNFNFLDLFVWLFRCRYICNPVITGRFNILAIMVIPIAKLTWTWIMPFSLWFTLRSFSLRQSLVYLPQIQTRFLVCRLLLSEDYEKWYEKINVDWSILML